MLFSIIYNNTLCHSYTCGESWKVREFFLFVQGNLKCLLVCKIREIVRVCHCSGKFEMLACCEIRDIFECVMI